MAIILSSFAGSNFCIHGIDGNGFDLDQQIAPSGRRFRYVDVE
jgi:hypothetical protein